MGGGTSAPQTAPDTVIQNNPEKTKQPEPKKLDKSPNKPKIDSDIKNKNKQVLQIQPKNINPTNKKSPQKILANEKEKQQKQPTIEKLTKSTNITQTKKQPVILPQISPIKSHSKSPKQQKLRSSTLNNSTAKINKTTLAGKSALKLSQNPKVEEHHETKKKKKHVKDIKDDPRLSRLIKIYGLQ